MTLTESNRKFTKWGDDNVIRTRLTFTGVTSGTWVSGLGSIANLQLTNLTAPERAMNPDYTTTAGSVAFTSVTSGDVVDVIAVGTT